MSLVLLRSSAFEGRCHTPLAGSSGPCRVERTNEERLTDADAGLARRAQLGDREAFEELMGRHRRRILRTLIHIVGSVEEAQDALQDTFLKAYQHIGGFEHRSKFATWLTSIATNTGLQRLREQKSFEYLDDPGDYKESRPRQMRSFEADPEELFSRAERRTIVQTGLRGMPGKYREVLLLRDIEELSTEEAASTLGLGISALKARLFRARLMLRDALARHFQSHPGKRRGQLSVSDADFAKDPVS